MKIISQAPVGTLNLSQVTPAALQHLKTLVGQTINITVTQVSQNNVTLQYGGQTLQAQSTLDLKPQSQLQVRVNESQGQIQLSVQPQAKPETLQQQLLRQVLPTQTPINQTLNFLTQPQNFQLLPTVIQGLLTSLIEQLLRPQHITGKKLQDSIAQSGQFLENQLKNNQTANISKDLKARLFQLQQQISQLSSQQRTPTLTQALTLVNQSIQAIQFNQLQQMDFEQGLLASITLQNHNRIDAIQLEFRKNSEQTNSNWEVVFKMNLQNPALDEQLLECKITMDDQEQFKIWFFSKASALRTQVENQFELLKEGFSQAGLALNLLQFSAQPLDATATSQSLGLIDIKV